MSSLVKAMGIGNLVSDRKRLSPERDLGPGTNVYD